MGPKKRILVPLRVSYYSGCGSHYMTHSTSHYSLNLPAALTYKAHNRIREIGVDTSSCTRCWVVFQQTSSRVVVQVLLSRGGNHPQSLGFRVKP